MDHTNSDTVTHPSTNQAQRRLTWLIETNVATTTPRRHMNICYSDAKEQQLCHHL